MGVGMREGLRHSRLEDVAATYERSLAEAAGGGEAVAFAYARTALQAILTAEEIGAGDEVVLSPLTCKVIPLALLALGIRPVFADIAARRIESRPREGRGCDKSPHQGDPLPAYLRDQPRWPSRPPSLPARRGLILIEDCAQNLPWWVVNPPSRTVREGGNLQYQPPKALAGRQRWCGRNPGPGFSRFAEGLSRSPPLSVRHPASVCCASNHGFTRKCFDRHCTGLCLSSPALSVPDTVKRESPRKSPRRSRRSRFVRAPFRSSRGCPPLAGSPA